MTNNICNRTWRASSLSSKTIEIFAFSGESRNDIASMMNGMLMARKQNENSRSLAVIAQKSRDSFSHEAFSRFLAVVPAGSDLTEFIEKGVEYLNTADDEDPSQPRVYFYGEGPVTGKIAFLYPGQGSQYVNMGHDLFCLSAQSESVIKNAEEFFGPAKSLGSFMYPPGTESANEKKELEGRLRQTEIAQPAIGITSLVMTKILNGYGIFPEMTAGHSFGELSALWAGNRLSERDFLYLSVWRGRLMAAACGPDKGQMLAVKAHPKKIEALIKESRIDLVLANRNSPEQGVLSGGTGEIERMQTICKENRLRAMPLPVSAAFHSRLVSDAADGFSEKLESVAFLPESIPVYSNKTALPYPSSPVEARRLLAGHLVSPVNFIDQIINMHADGAHTFVEVGPKNALTGLVRSILKDFSFESLALDASGGRQNGVHDLAVTLARLAVSGYPVEVRRWESGKGE